MEVHKEYSYTLVFWSEARLLTIPNIKGLEACEFGLELEVMLFQYLLDDIRELRLSFGFRSKKLQKLIDKTTAWCCENDKLIDAEKTKIMHFRHKNICTTFIIMTMTFYYLYHFYYNDQVLDYCSEHKYLVKSVEKVALAHYKVLKKWWILSAKISFTQH